MQNLSSKETTLSVNTPLCYLQVVEKVESSSSTDTAAGEDESFWQMFDLMELQTYLSHDDIEKVNRLLCKWKSVFSVGELDRSYQTLHKVN